VRKTNHSTTKPLINGFGSLRFTSKYLNGNIPYFEVKKSSPMLLIRILFYVAKQLKVITIQETNISLQNSLIN